jgi:ribonuclease HII
MQKVLNFNLKQKKEIKEIMNEFKETKTKNPFEEKRIKINDSVVTLYSTGKLVIQGKDCEKTTKKILQKIKPQKECFIGIDETGRGETNGPFVISAVLGNNNELIEIRDSKKTRNLKQKNDLITKNSKCQIIFSLNAEYIDELRNKKETMNSIEEKAINSIIDFFDSLKEKSKILIDGKEMKGIKKGEFIIKGDDSIPVIGAASILAKNYRENSKDKKKRKSWKTKN